MIHGYLVVSKVRVQETKYLMTEHPIY